MNSNVFKEYDLIVTKDNYIWVVHGVCGRYLVCRLKYVPDSQKGNVLIRNMYYRRLHSPLFKNNYLQFDMHDYSLLDIHNKVFHGLFCINTNFIIEHYSVLENSCNKNTITAKVGKELLHVISDEAKINVNMIGFTGSLLLGCEQDGYSDIDIVIYGRNNYDNFQNWATLNNIEKLSYRTQEEWLDFYNHFSVSSDIQKNEFSQLMRNNFYQGTYDGILFSIFVGRNDLMEYDRLEEISRIQIGGTIVENHLSHYFPYQYGFMSEGKYYNLQSWRRIDRNRFSIGDEIEIQGFKTSGSICLIPKACSVEYKLYSKKGGA